MERYDAIKEMITCDNCLQVLEKKICSANPKHKNHLAQ